MNLLILCGAVAVINSPANLRGLAEIGNVPLNPPASVAKPQEPKPTFKVRWKRRLKKGEAKLRNFCRRTEPFVKFGSEVSQILNYVIPHK